MNENLNEMYGLAQKSTQTYDAENMSDMLERESRRYSRRLSEEEEARLR